MNTTTSLDVAQFFTLIDKEISDLSCAKLRMLVYYVQGFNLAFYDKPMFDEPIIAAIDGPVCVNTIVYYSDNVRQPKTADYVLSWSDKEIIIDVQEAYGQFAAWKLKRLTLETPPFKNTKPGQEISHELLRNYFISQIR